MTDGTSGAADPRDHRPVEFKILAALWRWIVPILLVAAIAAGSVWYVSRTDLPLRTVQSEILVRMGYEYSPVPWSSVSETQQINFRADEVIGTEIQLLTSEGAIQKALLAAPHPEIGAATNGTYDAAQVLLARQKLAVKRLEGSNVILVEVTDPDPAWSIAFSQALLDTYLQDRATLFASPAYDQLLDQDATAAASAAAKLDGEAREISQRIAETLVYLSDSAASLVASPAQPELRDALATDIRGLQVYVGGMDNMTATQDALARIEQVLSTTVPPAATTGTGSLVSDDLLKAAVDKLTADATRLGGISAERTALAKRLDTIQTAQLRKSMRDGASNKMTIMTPPRLLATTSGFDRVQRIVLAGLMALILSGLFFVYIEGLRRRSA